MDDKNISNPDNLSPENNSNSADRQWAEKLGVPFNPATPPIPPTPTPPAPSSQYSTQIPPSPHSPQTPHFVQNKPNPVNSNPDEEPPMPKSYVIWAIVCTLFCCFIPGILAVFFASQVSSRYFAGDYEGAFRASRRAQIWIIVSFVLGLVANTIYIPVMLFGGLS